MLKKDFYTLVRKRVGLEILFMVLAAEQRWDDTYEKLANDLVKKISVKVGVHPKDKAHGGDFL